MHEATGNAVLIGIVTSIIGLIMVVFIGSLNFSKAYKIKNHIINEIEQNEKWDDNVKSKVDDFLKDVGYNVRKENVSCPSQINQCEIEYNTMNSNDGFDYCVYKCENGTYYKVMTFIKFDLPIVGDMVKFKVTGETKPLTVFK